MSVKFTKSAAQRVASKKHNTVIVYGPQGCGKTQNSAQIKKQFNCGLVIDGWDAATDVLVTGALHLTQAAPVKNLPARVVAFSSLKFK